jgi:hypothetical protein
LVTSCVDVVGVNVDVGNEFLNAVVPVNVLLLAWTDANVVFVSAYAFVTSCADVVGVKVDVGNDELNVLVPVN